MRIGPEVFRYHGILEHGRLAHVVGGGAVMRKRRNTKRQESASQSKGANLLRIRAPHVIDFAVCL